MTIDLSQDVLRATTPGLWVVRHGAYPAGTIEQGRCYTALDTSGDVVARCDTLHDAWEALCGDAPHEPQRAAAATPRSTRWLTVAGLCCAPLIAVGELAVLVAHG